MSTASSRPIVETCAWLAIALALTYCALVIDLEHNVISWHPQGMTSDTIEALVIYALGMFAAAWLAPRTNSIVPTVAMWIVLSLLLLGGVCGLRPEYGADPKPRTPSPLWYRGATCAALAFPIAVAIARRRHLRVVP